MLSDFEKLDYILDESNPWEKRYRLAQFFDNEDLIKHYVTKIKNVEIRLVFLRKIRDQDILLFLAFNDPDSTVRKLSVMALNNTHHEEFMVIAVKDPMWFVRLAAIEKLPVRYQNFYGTILIEEEHDNVRKWARDKIRLHEISLELLFRLAIEAWDPIVRKSAFRHISSEEMLYQLVMKSTDYTVAEQAIEKIENQLFLRSIAETAEFGHIRAYASMKVSDEKFLAELFMNDTSPFVREICLKKITSIHELVKLRLLARSDLQSSLISRIRELKDKEEK